MSDTKFTPGPWAWSEDKWNGGWSGLYAEDETPVVVPQSLNDGDDGAAWFASVDDAGEEGLTDANRALIAAAPELYESLTTLLLIVGLTAFKHESQRAVLQEAVDGAYRALSLANKEVES